MSLEDHAPDRRSRRQWLATIATAGTGALAGCSGGDDGERPTGDEPTTAGTPTTASRRTGGEAGLDPTAYGPPDADATWERTFVDFFADGTLDTAKWSVGIEGHHDGTHCVDAGPRSFCWTPDHVTVDDATDRLRLRTTDEPVPPTDREPTGTSANYAAGAVNTRGAFAQEFGYFEVASRIPDQPGTLPAAWLFHDKFDHDWREIDIYEKNGAHDADVLKMGTWFERDDDGPDPPDVEGTDNDDRIQVGAGDGSDRVRVDGPVDERFQVIGLEWAPAALRWYVDGEAVGRVDHPGVAEHLPGVELYLILNGAVWEGADWLGSPAEATFPHFHEFEWVRVWQRADWR